MSVPSEAAGVVREAIDVRRFSWIRPLVGAYTHDFASVASFFAGDPADESARRETIARVQRAPRDRERLTALLDRQLARRGAPAEARQAVATLRDPRAVAVVTGQQAGLFGGPFYTLLKAITALQLAHRVRTDQGSPAVAVFWVEGEDHDWQEIRTAEVLDAELAVRRVTLGDLPGAGARPAATLVLDERIGEALAELETVLPPTEFTADLMIRLRRHYRPGAGIATAFASWLDDLVGRHGLVVFEAADPEAKPLVSDVFVRELDAPRTGDLARQAGEALARLGHEPQVEPATDSVALFYLDETGRHMIKRRDPGYAIGDTVRPAGELRAEATRHPERFSPSVLLRPVVQDRLFPTVCYVGGPSELAYLAQLGGVYREFGVEAPLVCPRASVTLLDAASVRFLDRYRVRLEALHTQDESALNELLERLLPLTVDQALAATERDLVDRARVLKSAVEEVDTTLGGAVDTTVDRMRGALKSLRDKIIHATKRKDETLRRQFTHARALAFPGGDPQERALNVVFFVNRYGPALCDRLIETLPIDGGHHYLLTL